MRFLSMCSGIEAVSVAWHPFGWTCAAIAEIEPFCCALLKHYYSAVPNLGDVSKITQAQVEALGHIDVVVFGFPCQDLSVAGQRKGLHANGTQTRSGLFFDCARIADQSGARFVVAENVPGLFSSNEGRDFGAVVGELAGCRFGVPSEGWRNAGVALGPKGLVEWATLDAQFWNLAQRRERVFIVRDSGDWANRPPLFLERESMCWNPPPRREARQGTARDLAPCVGNSGRGFERTGETRGQDCVIPEVAGTIRSASDSPAAHGKVNGTDRETLIAFDTTQLTSPGNYSVPQDGDPCHPISVTAHPPAIAHSLIANGHDASEDGTGRGVPLVSQCISARNERYDAESQDFIPVAFHTANSNMLGPIARKDGIFMGVEPHSSQTRHAVMTAGMSVRRLTPREVERLMGFPDDYTLIPYRGKPACDGPRYRALGNSFAVPVVRWLGRRIELVERATASSVQGPQSAARCPSTALTRRSPDA